MGFTIAGCPVKLYLEDGDAAVYVRGKQGIGASVDFGPFGWRNPVMVAPGRGGDPVEPAPG